MRYSIVYFSQTGNTRKMGEVIREGIESVDRTAQVQLINVAEDAGVDGDFLQQSDAVIFGTPTYVAGTCWQLKRFLDTSFQYQLGGKLAGCYATAGCQWGGGEAAIQNILEMALTRGMLVYSSGVERGRPFIHLGPVAFAGHLKEAEPIFQLFGQRMAEKTLELFHRDA